MESYANEMPTFGDLTNVSVEKLEELNAVLATILALPIARDTYAQIIDGKPTRTPYSEENKSFQSGTEELSSVSGNSKPTDRAYKEYEKIRKAFEPQNLIIDLKLAQDYQNTPLGSRENKLRLLQIAAASLSALARRIYQNFHPDVNIRPPRPPEGHNRQFRGTDRFYVNFYHTSYRQFERYPFGLLDVVGYWAETELFGGVMLFEREESGTSIMNAFLHPQRLSITFQLSEKQLGNFAGLKEKGATAEIVLPFAEEAGVRTESPVVRVGEGPLRIYKNEYDKPPVSHWPVRSSCVIKEGDPGFASFEKAIETIEEKGWDKGPGTASGALQPPPSLGSAHPTAEDASKDDPLLASKEDE